MNDLDQDEEERDMALLRGHAAQLAEHFDTVHVFATRLSEDGTINCQHGTGNWFARYGQVKAWVVQEEGDFHARGAKRKGDDDE